MLLGVQQFLEGMVWVTGAGPDPAAAAPYSLGYMFFAWVGWPVWLPVSVYFTEPPRRHTPYLVFAIAGGALGALQFVPYFAHQGWLEVTLLDNAVRYDTTELLDWVTGRPLTYLLYATIVIAPLLMASNRSVRIFGVLVGLVLATTVAFFQWAYISVFCFGGALASVYLLWALRARTAGLASERAQIEDPA
jgi:hypothetical protein